MAKTVYDEVEITLQDGKDITLRPLPIGLLKKFMKVWGTLSDVEGEFDSYDIFVNLAGISISREYKDKFEKPVNADGSLSDDFREYLEEYVDTPTIYKIIEVASGIDLTDPKLVEEAERIQAETLGTT